MSGPFPSHIDELELAFNMVSGGNIEQIGAYVSKETGEIFFDDESVSGEPCQVEDIEYDPGYVAVPDKYDLDLGQALVWRFVRREIPGLEPKVRGFFRHRGAYGRYKDFLAEQDLLDAWHAFEDQATRQALFEWCRENDLPIVDQTAPALSPEQSEQLKATSRLIRTRRSIKPADMSDAAIDRDLLGTIFQNANWAPTHGLTEPWRFKVYCGDARRKLAEALQRIYREVTPEADYRPEKFAKLGRNPMLAPVVIVLCMRRQPTLKIPEIEEIEAVACAVQNMHLTASSAGLGGYWSSPPLVYSEAMREWLGLEENDRCLGLFYLGWPKEPNGFRAGRRRPVEEKIEWVDGSGD